MSSAVIADGAGRGDRAVAGSAAFVAPLAVELGRRPTPSWSSVEGSLLSADISGFTALSERLASLGKAGAEEITSIVNVCFATLIDEASRFGGEVITFGGDALLVLFRGDRHERRAADAGLAMQRSLRASPAARRAALTMTVGAAAGPFDVFVVGDEYRELLIVGERASEVIRLEAAAQQGDTLVDAVIAAALSPSMHLRTEAGGVVVTGQTGDEPFEQPPAIAPTTAEVRPYVPSAVIDQLAAFSGLGGEHRLVTVGFVLVTGFAELIDSGGHDATARALAEFFDSAVTTCHRFGVAVLHSDIATNGFKLVLSAGAPVNLGDTSDAMLQAALGIATIDSPFVIRQGVQTGRVFAGFLGSAQRQTYTLMGDPVNTAARMLDKAGDREVVAVDAVIRRSRAVFETDELDPFHVKGKTERIVAHRVRALTGRLRRERHGHALVGRDAELAQLTRAVVDLGSAVEVVGGAGVGKTRLLDAVWRSAENTVMLHAGCTPFGAAAPFGAFRPLLRRSAGIPLDADSALAGIRLAEVVAANAPHLAPMLPLLALPFGAAAEPTTQARAVDPQFRPQRICETVIEFLDALAPDRALITVVEDAHWIDASSGELLNEVIAAAASRRWCVIVSRRPGGEWAADELAHVVRISLEALTDEAITRLAIDVSTSSLGDADLAMITRRAQGNPLFAIELVRALSDPASKDLDLPDSIEQIIAGRFDRLAPDARRIIRTASVLGNVFDEGTVASMLGVEDDHADAVTALDDSESAGVIVRRAGSAWSFIHALYRDAAYEGLPFARRRYLHRLAAQLIEAGQQDPTPFAAILCQHYSAGGAHDKTWEYGILAGQAAEQQHATSEAITNYERALGAARHLRSVGPTARASVAERLGDLCYVAARFDDAERLLRRGRRLVAEPIDRARLGRKLAAVFERQGRPKLSLRTYQRSAAIVPHRTRSRPWLVERAHVLLGEAGLRARYGENSACVELARRALNDAERTSDDALMALALERLHLGLSGLAVPDADDVGRRALATYERLNDPNGMSRTLNNLGVEAYFESRWNDATDFYGRSLEAATRAGNVVMCSNSAVNSAVILADQGHWDDALRLFSDAARNYQAVRNGPGMAAQRLFAVAPQLRGGDLDAARHSLETARSELTELRGLDLLPELLTRELELAVLSGRATVADCDAIAGQLGNQRVFVSRVSRCRAVVLYGRGDHDGARAALLVDIGSEHSAGFERTLSLNALITLFPDDPDRVKWKRESTALQSELGVVRLPPLRPSELTERSEALTER